MTKYEEWKSFIPNNEIEIKFVVHYRDFDGDNLGYYCEPVDTFEKAQQLKDTKISQGKNVKAYIVEETIILREANVAQDEHLILIPISHIAIDGRISQALHKLETFVRNLKDGTNLDADGKNDFNVNSLLFELNSLRGISNNDPEVLKNLKVVKKN